MRDDQNFVTANMSHFKTCFIEYIVDTWVKTGV